MSVQINERLGWAIMCFAEACFSAMLFALAATMGGILFRALCFALGFVVAYASADALYHARGLR